MAGFRMDRNACLVHHGVAVRRFLRAAGTSKSGRGGRCLTSIGSARSSWRIHLLIGATTSGRGSSRIGRSVHTF